MAEPETNRASAGRATLGVSRPYAIVERFFANTRPIGAPRPFVVADVNGRRAWLYVGIYGQGSVEWTLPDGSETYIRARGFNVAELTTIARALRPRTARSPIPGFDIARPGPFGLTIVGETSDAVQGSAASSACKLADGTTITVAVLRGDAVFRFGVALDYLPLPTVSARGDSVLTVVGPKSSVQTASSSVRNASPQRWAALVPTTHAHT